MIAALTELAALLKQSNMEALQKFADQREQLQMLPDDLCDQLDEALQELDFKTAHSICVSAQAQLANSD